MTVGGVRLRGSAAVYVLFEDLLIAGSLVAGLLFAYAGRTDEVSLLFGLLLPSGGTGECTLR